MASYRRVGKDAPCISPETVYQVQQDGSVAMTVGTSVNVERDAESGWATAFPSSKCPFDHLGIQMWSGFGVVVARAGSSIYRQMRIRKVYPIVAGLLVLTAGVWQMRMCRKEVGTGSPDGAGSSGPGSFAGGNATAPGEMESRESDIVKRLGFIERRSNLAAGKDLEERLRSSLDSGDMDAFRQVANELRHRFQGDPKEVLESLKGDLESAAPGGRLALAELFLSCAFEVNGARSVILDIVGSSSPVVTATGGQGRKDLRISAAEVLAAHRISEAKESIWSLYGRTRDVSILPLLADLGDDRVAGAIRSRYANPGKHKKLYKIFGQLRMEDARDSMSGVYQNIRARSESGKPVIIDLSWALYRITGEAEYLDVLVKSRNKPQAARYLSGLEGSEVRPALESLLYTNLGQQEKAFLGLYKNHRDSPVLKQYILEWFSMKRPALPMPEEMVFMVASKLDDPEIDAAAIKFSDATGRSLWRFYNEYREDWPLTWLYNGRLDY